MSYYFLTFLDVSVSSGPNQRSFKFLGGSGCFVSQLGEMLKYSGVKNKPPQKYQTSHKRNLFVEYIPLLYGSLFFVDSLRYD